MLEKIEQTIAEEFFSLPESRKPGDLFTGILEKVRQQDEEKAVLLLENILKGINDRKNKFYLRALFEQCPLLLERNMLFLIDQCNTALDVFLSEGDIKYVFWLLKKIGKSGDARTIAIINYYTNVYRDRSVTSRLKGYRNIFVERVRAVSRKLEQSEMKPILKDHLVWQE